MAIIVAQHQINDPEKFFALSNEVVENVPSGIRARQFCPSADRTQAVCLWEADSVDALRGYLDSIAGRDVTDNTYYLVNEEYALGLPQEAATSA
jgi:hypothetical protein